MRTRRIQLPRILRQLNPTGNPTTPTLTHTSTMKYSMRASQISPNRDNYRPDPQERTSTVVQADENRQPQSVVHAENATLVIR